MLGFAFLLCLATDASRLTVAADGSADFKTMQAALDRAPTSGAVIYIRPGIYREKLVVNKAHIQLRGTGSDASKVVLSYDDSAGTAGGTTKSASVTVNHCRLTADPGAQSVYLGRPWRAYSTVVFMNTKMDLKIEPEGCHEWEHDGKASLPTLFYAEYKSSGEGANPSRKQLSEAEAKQFELTTFFDGWNAAEVH
jgi:pectin methylesterase-like acyl-CoA thioesterase